MTNSVFFGPSYFPDNDTGRPVSNGYIYVGDPDTDPEIAGNQKTVLALQEDGTTPTMSQPIRTSVGGVPTYDGSTVTLLVEGDYSVKVLNSSGSQVHYIPSVIELLLISDTAYGSSWDGVTDTAPSKNAVYDKILAMISDTAYAASWDNITDVSPSKNAVYDKIESLSTDIDAVKTIQPGEITIWGGLISNLPANRLLCDGSSLLRAGIYADLFAAIGTVHGAADGTHFNLPNLTDRFIIHADDDSGGTNDVADSGGSKTHTHNGGSHALTAAELAAHSHSMSRVGSSYGGAGGGATPFWWGNTSLDSGSAGSGAAHSHGATGGPSARDLYYALAYTIVY